MQGSPPRATRCCPNPAAAAGETAYAPPKAVVEMTQTQSPGLCVHWVASGAVLGTSMASSRAKQHSAFLYSVHSGAQIAVSWSRSDRPAPY